MAKTVVAIISFLFIVGNCFSQEDLYIMKIYFSNQPSDDITEIRQNILSSVKSQDEIDMLYKKVRFFAESAPLKTVLYGILSDTKFNVAFDPDVDTNIRLTVKFEDIELLSALNTLMQMSNLKFILEGKTLKVKTTDRKVFKLPYVKTSSSYSSKLGGDLTGGAGGGAGGSAGGAGAGAGNIGVSGSFSVDFEGDKDTYDVYSQIENNIKSFLSEKGKVTMNKFTGTIIVEDRPDRIRLVENFLANIKKEIDKQVLIEARIIEVNLSEGYQYGIDWSLVARNLLNSGVTLSQNLSLSGSVASLSVVRADMNALINAVGTFGKVNTLSNPRVLVVNNQTAILTAGSIYPFWDKQLNVTGGNNTTQSLTTVTYQRRNVLSGIIFGVTPHIEDDGEITINVVPISTSLQGIRQHREGNVVVAESPIINIKQAGTIVKVKDGDVIIIGGLINKEEKDEESKLPLIGDVPVIGYLFKQKTKLTQTKELVIFLKVSKIDLNNKVY